MSYRFLIVNLDYDHFLHQLYHRNPGLSNKPFSEQYSARIQSLFGMNDFYSSNLRKFGHEAIDLIYNNRYIQYAWAIENGLMRKLDNEALLPTLSQKWMDAVFEAQVKKYKPDVIINLAMELVTSRVLNAVKPHVPLIVGQHAAPFTNSMKDLSAYDLVLSSIPHYVDYFQNQGVEGQYFRLGFESTILDTVPTTDERPIDIAFVGGFATHHMDGTNLFNYLADQEFTMALYGYGQESLSPKARSFFGGGLYGRDMFELYSRTKIVINRHINISGEYANNMRLYEATGMGSLLITDNKKNLQTFFDMGNDIIPYHSMENCAELIRYYLKDNAERKRIAANGQKRILADHTYFQRMSELTKIVNNYFNRHNLSSKNNLQSSTVSQTKAVNLSEATQKKQNPLILLYHRIADDPINSQLLAVSPANFEKHLKKLAENYRVVPLAKLLDEVRQNRVIPNTVAITFDDGYADNLTNALPLLEKYTLPATIFVTVDMVGSDREFWWDAMEKIFLANHPLPDTLSLDDRNGQLNWELDTPHNRIKAWSELCAVLHNKTVDEINQIIDMLLAEAGIPLVARETHLVVNLRQLKKLASSHLIEIGSHTVSHTRLSLLQKKEQIYEILMPKRSLESVIKKPVRFLSYPFGSEEDFTKQTKEIVIESGYDAAIANIQADLTHPTDMFAVPRWLVRDWPKQEFAQWLSSENKTALETQTLAAREQRLLDYLSKPTGRESNQHLVTVR